jgi:hypothetical protein
MMRMRNLMRFAIAVAVAASILGPVAADGFEAFVPLCEQSMNEQGSSFDREDVRWLCECVSREARTLGMTAATMAELVARTEADPGNPPESDLLRQASSTCSVRMIVRANEAIDRRLVVETARRNRAPVVPIRYAWSASKYEPDVCNDPIPLTAEGPTEVAFSDGTICTIGEPSVSETEEERLIMIQAVRKVSCAGAKIAHHGKPVDEARVRCAHSRDSRSGHGAADMLEVTPGGATRALGILYVRCDMEVAPQDPIGVTSAQR